MGFLILTFSVSPLVMDWHRADENCGNLIEDLHDFVLIGTILILAMILVTVFVYMQIYLFVVREKRRKITDYVRNKSLPTPDVDDLNKKLAKNLTRLNMLQMQTTFFISFASITMPYLLLTLVQVIDKSGQSTDMNSSVEIAKNFFFAFGQLILTIEPIMFYLSFRNIKKIF